MTTAPAELFTSTTRRFTAVLVQDRIDELTATVHTGSSTRSLARAEGSALSIVTGAGWPPDLPAGAAGLVAAHGTAVEAATDSVYQRPVCPQDAVDLLHRIRSNARETSTDLSHIQVRFEELAQGMVVSWSGQRPRRDTRRWVRTIVHAVACRDGATRTSGVMVAAPNWPELVRRTAVDCPGRQAAEEAAAQLRAVEPPAGSLPVVFAGATGAALIHEVCGHALEGDLLADRRSLFAESTGEPLASTAITVRDDPGLAGRWGSYRVDDEGSLARVVTLLGAGRVTGQVTCRESAARLGIAASGHARRVDYQHPPLPRLSNTCVSPGRERPQSLLSGIRGGVLVTDVANGYVNAMTGDFTLRVAAGRAIRDGRLGAPLGPGAVRGNVRTALAAITAIADDVSVRDAVCVKRGQRVPVSFSSPSLLVEHGLVVSA